MTTGRKRLWLSYWPTLQCCGSPRYTRGRRVTLCLTSNRERLWVVSLSPAETFFFLLRHVQWAASQMDGWNKLNLGRRHLACEPISHGYTDTMTDFLYRTQSSRYPYDILSLLRLWQMSSTMYFTEGPHQILSVWPHLCFYSYSRGTARCNHCIHCVMFYLYNLYFFLLRWNSHWDEKSLLHKNKNKQNT